MKTCLKLFSLDINKLHGHDNLFAIMIKICDSVIKDSCHNIKKIVLHQKLSKIFRKNWMLFQYIRKLINKLLIMTDQFLYFCFRENFWKSSFNSILKCQKNENIKNTKQFNKTSLVNNNTISWWHLILFSFKEYQWICRSVDWIWTKNFKMGLSMDIVLQSWHF